MAENTAPKQLKGRGRPFAPGQSGNPLGKPKGTRHRSSMLAEQLLEGEAECLVRKAVDLAMAGDTGALRLCIERIIPSRRDRAIQVELPPVLDQASALSAVGAICRAVGEGSITPSEAAALSGVIADAMKIIDAAELERRIVALEERHHGPLGGFLTSLKNVGER